MSKTISPGSASELGATFDGDGTNFALFSRNGSAVDLCLFDEHGVESRIRLPNRTADVYHGYVMGITPGQRYGFRVHGEWDPAAGHLFNSNNLLIDPYARAIDGTIDWSAPVFAYEAGNVMQMSEFDDAAAKPKAVVVDDAFDWGDSSSPKRRLSESILYETHVKGLTKLHPEVPNELRGTYAGMACEPVIQHLVELGVTAVQLMPVQHHVSEHDLIAKGLTNYWGYSTIGFFAPHGAYAATGTSGQQVAEFKGLVKALHDADIEVILDVVYNHTGESGPAGPALSFRGIDNLSYYRTDPARPHQYVDYTGTGNTLNASNGVVRQMIVDSLRYWITHMRVDGFRFDLAVALARDPHDFTQAAEFFDRLRRDPVISTARLIAEPWDTGPNGYQVGGFPPPWSELNGEYRDDVREFWRGDDGALGNFASRFTGSSDIYSPGGRYPESSINFVTSHDGFTLKDLVSYNEKHNDANGEDNRDGDGHNRSWNSGAEGATEDQEVMNLRKRRSRSILTTLLLSQGVPMIGGGDEIGRTQHGNNNAYCQDNDISWYQWEDVEDDLLAYTRELIRIRSEHPVFRHTAWFNGRGDRDRQEIAWFRNDGKVMTEPDWRKGFAKSLGVYINGDAIASIDDQGNWTHDDSFLILFNAHSAPVRFVMPDTFVHHKWQVVLYSATGLSDALPTTSPEQGDVAGWSVAVLKREQEAVS
ncbi:MAG: glycogen debranching protein GlgX [Acidimicrobiia bacterium]